MTYSPGEGNLKYHYGMTLAEYTAQLEKQHYTCPICGESLRDLPRCPPVDHDHETGARRMILCNACNMGLGFFRDSIPNLARAIIYLQDHGKTI